MMVPEEFGPAYTAFVDKLMTWPDVLGIPSSNLNPPSLGDVTLDDLVGEILCLPFAFFGVLILLHVIFYVFLRKSWGEKAHTVSFELSAGICVTYLSIIGLNLFYFRPHIEERILGFDRPCFHLAQVMLGYQFYDMAALFLIKGLFSMSMFWHHFFTGLLAYLGLFSFAHGFAPFFFGVIETSNIILTVVDIYKYGNIYKSYPNQYTFWRMLFAASFYVFRIYLWAVPTYEFWACMFESVFLNPDKKYSGNPKYVAGAAVFLLANAAITFLQLLWGVIITKGVFKAIFGGSKKKKKDNQAANAPNKQQSEKKKSK